MRTVDNFFDYELIDADDGMRLERWKDIILSVPTLRSSGMTGKETSAGTRLMPFITEAQAAADTGRDSERFPMSGRYLLKI